jgi:hypothetical protein
MDFEYWLVNYTRANNTKLRFVYPPDEFRSAMHQNRRARRFRRDLDLGSKFFFSLRFFMEQSSASWFYRATDDTIINFPNLYPFMQYLEAKYNPLTEPVIIGSCINVRRFSYLQGGSGILFSRYSAIRLIGARNSFLKSLNRPEDVYFVHLLEAMNISLYQATSEFFIRHDILPAHRGIVWQKAFDELPPCPDTASIWKKKCRAFVSPVNDLVFWHQEGRNQTLGPTIMFAKMILRLPRHIQWWSDKGRPHLCRASIVLPRLY